MACCVFAFLLSFLSFCLSPFAFRFISLPAFCPSPCLLCSGCLLLVLLSCLVCSCVLVAFVVVSFSLSDYAQKERAQRFCPLCPLFVCCCFLFYSSGSIPNHSCIWSKSKRNISFSCVALIPSGYKSSKIDSTVSSCPFVRLSAFSFALPQNSVLRFDRVISL